MPTGCCVPYCSNIVCYAFSSDNERKKMDYSYFCFYRQSFINKVKIGSQGFDGDFWQLILLQSVNILKLCVIQFIYFKRHSNAVRLCKVLIYIIYIKRFNKMRLFTRNPYISHGSYVLGTLGDAFKTRTLYYFDAFLCLRIAFFYGNV